MKDVVLYGAGSDIIKILPMLKNNGYHPLCIADGNEKKIGGCVDGIPIVSPKTIASYKTKTIIITASFFDSIYEKIEDLLGEQMAEYDVLVSPYAWLMLVNVEYNSELLNIASDYMELNKDTICSIYDLRDIKTKSIIDFFIKARLDREYRFYKYDEICGMQYVEGYFYENELEKIGDFTFVDIGAYIGDTFEMMLSTYSNMTKYYGYEPAEDNYKVLIKKLNDIKGNCKVSCENVALGRINGAMEMGKGGGEFGVIDDLYEDSVSVSVRKLDDEKIDVQGGQLVIKMDVEGAELDVLNGGIETIKKYKPIMAICVYHRYEDILILPKYLIDNGLRYRFILKSGIHTHLLAIPV